MVDDDNYNLFDESVFPPRQRPESSVLVIRQRKGRKLSKEQRTFNRLTKRIAELERRMATEHEKLDLLLDHYRDQVAPVEQELAQRKIELARALATAGSGFGLRKRQKEDLREMLMDLFDDVFEVMKPDAETEALYDEWSDTSYQEEIRQEAEALKRGMADALRTEYGIKMDVSDDDHSPEAMARLLHDAREKVRAAEAEMPRSHGRRRRASKEEDHEGRQRLHEALTRKSVRDVYLSLAKVLHPDTVAGAAERSLREEYMKQATFAYRQGDLAALLKLELRWVTRDDAGPNAFSDETLRVYIPALQDQLIRLERALDEQILDPRYAPIGPVATLPQRTALDGLDRRKRDLRAQDEAIEGHVRFVRSCRSKKALTTFIRDYFLAREAEWLLDDDISVVFDDDEWC